MNGSRSNTPNYGGKTSLDQLNRTIEGLEARIQGLVSERKQAQLRPSPVKADPLGEIMERQRALGGARERVAAAMDRSPRHEPEMRHQTPVNEPSRVDHSGALADIAATLQALRGEIRHDASDALAHDLSEIRSDMRSLRSSAASGGVESLRDDIARLGDSVERLGDTRMQGLPELRADLEELRMMTAGLAREESVRHLEHRWDRTEATLVAAFDPEQLREELIQLAWRIDGIKSGLGELNAAPAVRSLEDKLMALAGAIETIGRDVHDKSDLSHQFAGLDGRLDEISRAIAASASQSASAVDSSALRRLEGRIGELAEHINALPQPAPESHIAERIEALTQRIEELAAEDAAQKLEERIGHLSTLIERNFRETQAPDVSNHLADISRKIDGLGGNQTDALMARLEALSRQIGEFELPSETPPLAMADLTAMSRLESRLSEIASRLDETVGAPAADTNALQNLERQIANLSGLMNKPTGENALPDGFMGRTAIEDYIASSDEFIVEAARQAAEAVVEAYSRTGIGVGQIDHAEISALAGLAEDLRALEAHTRSSEERTAETFSALHETLVQIAGRLDDFGGSHMEVQSHRAPDYQPSPMPRAAQPDFSAATAVLEPQSVRRAPENPKVEVLHEPDLLDAAAEADITEDAIDAISAPLEKQKPASKSLIAGLAARLKPAKREKAVETARVSVDPAPALDPGDMLISEESSLLLEPGSGVPDVKKIMEKVRAGQNQAGTGARPAQADVIAAARRAAQAAAQEAGAQKFVQPAAMSATRPAKESKSLFSGAGEARRPIVLAAAAVLLVVMSYPLVSNLIKGRQAEAQNAVQPAISLPTNENSTAEGVADPVVAATAGADNSVDEAVVDSSPAVTPMETGTEKLMTPAENADQAAVLEKPVAEKPVVEKSEDSEPETIASPKLAESEGADAADGAQAAVAADTADLSSAEPMAPPVLPAGLQPASLVEAAKKGDALAYFEIGSRFTDGRGTKIDLAEAAKWYQLAADKGLAPAEYRLANFYEKGTGLSRDLQKAKALYLSASQKGNASAMHNLAVLNATGAAGTANFDEAVRWFREAAELNVRDSQFNLAILYARGNGVPQDLEESYKWFAVAAKQGDQDAAQKRDEIANALKPEQLKSAKAKFELWKPRPLDDTANSAVAPDEWVAKANTTATIDMKRAIRNIQAILNNSGFDAGTPDGELGKKTVTAIKAFQKSVGQEPTGRVDDALVRELLSRNKKKA
ncbi:SEL1-like repeat protein [Rhizobium sp. KVB221]|uniref:SEL1-like repeat protein n=1 Tax=Rhizobium setariae TaxID=2801340 RepID=A0A936YS57_9HYPH|nr:peptidoglycan-binding protein [Rhizobium setariae]MBL0371866.1 SEL1-like repeat protein [Rhizobium setariae]